MPTIICANLLWLTTHLRKRSMILNATASDAAASVYMSIGIMGRTRSTRAISERHTGSSFSRSEVGTYLILRCGCRELAELLQLQIGYRSSGRQDEPESVFRVLHGGIDTPGNCVSPIILDAV